MHTMRPEIRGSFGAVSSTHFLASQSGMAMLERGGNAFDAAIAAGFVLQVVEPHQNGLGGDMPAVAYDAKADRLFALCAQGPAPARATIGAYKALGVDMIPGTGLLAAVVPGAFDGWMVMLRDHGSMRLREVMEPAIHYARTGYTVTPALAGYIGEVAELLKANWPSSSAVYLSAGKVPEIGSMQCNTALANTYERLVREGENAGADRIAQIEAARDAYYRGFVAERIGRFCATTDVPDSTGRSHRGFLSQDDMASYGASYEAPAVYDYRGYTVAKTGPWGQGPAMLQALALIKGFDLDAMEPAGAPFIHTVTECLKLALADREAYYGDPVASHVPLTELLSDSYNDARRKLVTGEASRALRPGNIAGRAPRLALHVTGGGAARVARKGEGEPNALRLGASDTVNVNAVDRFGNLVSCMPSGGWLQSSPVIPELGFCLGTRAQMFWLEEGLPASLVPGTRPRTTLTPGLALRNGTPYMAFGSPGGDHQDQWALQLFLRHVHYSHNLQEAIEQPAFMTDHAPSSFYPRQAKPAHLAVEDRISPEARNDLARYGHELDLRGPWTIGRLCAVAREGAIVKAAASPRTEQGYAVGR
ncbi:MAG: gamma-glutamyltransferase family protein [Alphaproteobacteria bacterium]